MALRALTPGVKQPLADGWDLVVTQAGMAGRGLRMMITTVNGEPKDQHSVGVGVKTEEQRFIDDITGMTGLGAETIRKALVTLAYNTEGAWREQTRRKSNGDQGPAITFTDPEPCDDQVNGAELLEDLAEVYKRHLVLRPGVETLLPLWTLFTYCHGAFMISPILGIVSPEKRCGKTTLLTLLRRLVAKPLPGANVTPAVVYRSIEMYHPTLLVDEADTFLKDNDELRGVINSGHTRDTAFVLRSDGDNNDPRPFSTWGPKAIALIGKLPSTLDDRAIIVPMRRKRPGEKVDRLRLDRLSVFEELPAQCARWSIDHAETLMQSDPVIPEGLHDRAADNWRPLVAIADLCGWTDRVKDAITHLEQPDDDTESAGILLLDDMRREFTEQDTDFLFSKELAEKLATIEERPWPEWKNGKPITVRQIARLLSRYSIRPKNIRKDSTQGKGYEKQDCIEAFETYLTPSPPELIRPTVPDKQPRGFQENPIRPKENSGTDKKTLKPAPLKAWDGGTDEKPPQVSKKQFSANEHCPQPGCIGRLKLITGNALMCGKCWWQPPIAEPKGKGFTQDPEGDDIPF